MRPTILHRKPALLAPMAAAALLAVACAGPSAAGAAGSGSAGSGGAAAGSGSSSAGGRPADAGTPLAVSDNTWTDAIDPAAIPLGDGKVATSPRVGYVDSCTTSFRSGGAQHSGPWIDTARQTWNSRAKLAVTGHHLWGAASYHMTVQDSTRVITTNDLPVGLPAGTFPISPSEPAYRYDHNPNSVVAHSYTYRLPAGPSAAASPSCTSLGPIGVTTAGVLLFNALDAAGRDAGAHEIQDTCHGHPNGQDAYHYHSIPECLAQPKPGTSVLVGYALDGYGIYAEYNSKGNLPADADLDACHGRTSTVLWNGRKTVMYHYDVTLEYPYTVGCFHGTPVTTRPGQGGSGAGGRGQGGPGQSGASGPGTSGVGVSRPGSSGPGAGQNPPGQALPLPGQGAPPGRP